MGPDEARCTLLDLTSWKSLTGSTSMEKRIRSDAVKIANADRGLIPKFVTKIKDSRECRIKRVF